MTTVPADTHTTSRALWPVLRVGCADHVLDVVRAALAEHIAWGPDGTTRAPIAPDAHGTAHCVRHAHLWHDRGSRPFRGGPGDLWATGDTSLPPADVTASRPRRRPRHAGARACGSARRCGSSSPQERTLF